MNVDNLNNWYTIKNVIVMVLKNDIDNTGIKEKK